MRAASELRSPLAAALALTAAALFFGGGAGNGTLPWVGGAAVLLAAVLTAARGAPPGAARLLPLAALALWCAVSVAWSIEPDRSWDYANRAAVYVAFALVGAHVAGRSRDLAYGVAGVLGALCAWSLAGKVFPWLYEDYGRIARLRGPIGYWNVLALIGDVALPIGLWLATRVRTAGVLLVYGWLVAIALTYSRGGVIVGVIVVALWLALSGQWLRGVATLVAAGVPAAGVLALAFSLNGVTSDGASHAARVHDGAVFGAALVVGAGVAALLALIPPPDPVPAVRRAALALVVVAAAAAVLVAALHARTWWDEFRAPAAPELSNSSARFAQVGSNHRWTWWQEAWRGFRQNELVGTGAGSFQFTNLRYRASTVDSALEPHNVPLQFLSETGIVGLVLFLATAGVLLAGARRPTDPELALGLALPAFLLNGLVDIDWDFLSAAGPVFLLAGALAAAPLERPRFSFSGALAAAGFAFLALSSLAAVWLGGRWTGQALDALGVDTQRSITLAQRARSVQPLSIEPLLYEADAQELLAVGAQRGRRLGAALGLLQKATEIQPKNAEAWYTLAEFNFRVRHCPRAALPEFERSYELNPQDPGLTEKDHALAQVNSGTPVC